MEMESGKLFIGGISWETNEERLKEYFQSFGEVIEAVIMKDRATGRARGFGFVVFANALVAEKVVRERHIIDGRTVEAKKAVPRDDHQNFNRNNGSIQGSPGPTRTKKIFVGGLASTVTESDFKRYFDQFGTITDVVVMYDHNTQRPRGFGFITYDSEEAVDKVLFRTFHELNGKMVEVKRAVPRELSPGPIRSQLSANNYGPSRVSSFLNAYNQGYSSSSPGDHGMRMDGRFSPATIGRNGYSHHSPSNYSMGLNLDNGFGLNYGASGNSGLGYGRAMNSYFTGNTNRYGTPVGFDVGVPGNGSSLNSPSNQSFWGSNGLNYSMTNSVSSNTPIGPRTANAALTGNFGSKGDIWGFSGKGGENGIRYGSEETEFGGRSGHGRSNVGGTSSFSATNDISNGGWSSFYDDHAWRSPSTEIKDLASFGYHTATVADAVTPNSNVDYIGGYSVNASSNRGIAA